MKRTGAILSLLVTLLGPAAHAVPTSGSSFLNFDAGRQSLWGPGGRAASFEVSGGVGNSDLGFRYEVKASSGTVERASFDGSLSYSYDDDILLGTPSLASFNFSGAGNGGLIDTLFGASITTKYRILGFEGCIYCAGASLDIDKRFTPKLDTKFTGSDTATPVTVEVGPNLSIAGVGGKGTAGVDIDVTQRSTLEGKGVSGTVVATNRATGSTRSAALAVLDNNAFAVDLGLDEVGFWDISLAGLRLDNSFFSSFTGKLVPFVEYFLGFNCGDDFGSDADNGFGCIGDGRESWNLASLSLGSTQTFSLGFNALSLSNAFGINVRDAVVAVPEPGTLTLIGAGLLALGWLRRRRAGPADA